MSDGAASEFNNPIMHPPIIISSTPFHSTPNVAAVYVGPQWLALLVVCPFAALQRRRYESDN